MDIGGGSSRLVDCLVADGYGAVTVLDISSRALEMAQARLADKAQRIQWIQSDVLRWDCTSCFDIWHDGATYHFLTEPYDRQSYISLASQAVEQGGALIVANFALDSPCSCSGLLTYRTNAEMIAADFAHSFDLEDSRLHDHITLRGVLQRFHVTCLRRK